jgi:quinol monooxygenase YgiN
MRASEAALLSIARGAAAQCGYAAARVRLMTFVNVGTLGTVPGKRDLLVKILTRRSADLEQAGCLLYEVGVNEDSPDTVFVAESWISAQAHQESLQLDSVQAAVQEARPLLSGQMDGFRFETVGSPLRD